MATRHETDNPLRIQPASHLPMAAACFPVRLPSPLDSLKCPNLTSCGKTRYLAAFNCRRGLFPRRLPKLSRAWRERAMCSSTSISKSTAIAIVEDNLDDFEKLIKTILKAD